MSEQEESEGLLAAVEEILKRAGEEKGKEYNVEIPRSVAEFVLEKLDLASDLQDAKQENNPQGGKTSSELDDSLTSMIMGKLDKALENSRSQDAIVVISLNFREVHQIGMLALAPVQNYKSLLIFKGKRIPPNLSENPYYQSYMTIHNNFFRSGGTADIGLTSDFTRLVTDPEFKLSGGEIKL